MPLYDPVLPARYAQPLLDFLWEQQPRLGEALLQSNTWLQPHASGNAQILTLAQYDHLVQQVALLSGRSDLGLEMGRRIGMHSHHSLSLVLCTCNTLDAIFRMAARFWRQVTTSFVVSYRRHKTYGEWVFRPSAAMSRATLHTMEELFAVSVHHDYTALLGTQKGIDIYLSMPKPAHDALYQKLTPSRFHFGASALPEVRCVLPIDMLDKPFRQPGVGADSLQLADLLKLPSLGTPQRSCGDWVRLMLHEAEGIQPSRQALAALLNVSPRTFSRSLAADGLDFRLLSNTIRHQRACHMLRHSSQRIAQISYRLGYSEPAAFTRAFQTMAGMGPLAYRQQKER